MRGCYGLPWTLHCPRARYCDVTMLWHLLLHGIRADLGGTLIDALTTRIHGDHGSPFNRLILRNFNAIFYIFLLNNSIYIIGRNCRLGTVFRVFNKCSGFRLSVTLSSWWHGRGAMRAGANNFLQNRWICYFKAPLHVVLIPREVCLTISRNRKVFLLYLLPLWYLMCLYVLPLVGMILS